MIWFFGLSYLVIAWIVRCNSANMMMTSRAWRKLGNIEREALAVFAGMFWPILVVFAPVYLIEWYLEKKETK
jgi:hypothetical protein